MYRNSRSKRLGEAFYRFSQHAVSCCQDYGTTQDTADRHVDYSIAFSPLEHLPATRLECHRAELKFRNTTQIAMQMQDLIERKENAAGDDRNHSSDFWWFSDHVR